MGVGAAERVNMVRWHVGRDMLITWVLTIPCTFIVSAVMYFLLLQITGLFG
jgi:PiT family inorganic phosphate transporter